MNTRADLSSSVNHDPVGSIRTSETSKDMGSNIKIENASSNLEIAIRSKTLNPIKLSNLNKVSTGEIKTVNTKAGKITRSRIPILSYMPSIPPRPWTTLSSQKLSSGKVRTNIPVLAKKPVFPLVNIMRTPINPGNCRKTYAFEEPCLNRVRSLTSFSYSRQEFPREKLNLKRSLTILSYSRQEFPREKLNLKRSLAILSYSQQEFPREKLNLKRSLTILSCSRQEYPREKLLNSFRSLTNIGYNPQMFALEQPTSNRRCLKPGTYAKNFVREESSLNRAESCIPSNSTVMVAPEKPSISRLRAYVRRNNSPKKMIREESKLNISKPVNVVGTSIKFLREESNVKKIEPKLTNSTVMVAPERPSTSRLTSYVKRNNSPKKMIREESKLNITKRVDAVGTSPIKFLREESNVKKIEPPKLSNSTVMLAPEKPTTSRLRSYVKRNNSPTKMIREESKLNITKPVNVVGTSIKFLREESNIKKIEPPKLSNSTVMVASEKPSTSRLRSYVKRNNSPKKMIREESMSNITKPVNAVGTSSIKFLREESNVKKIERPKLSNSTVMLAPEKPSTSRLRSYVKRNNSPKKMIREESKLNITKPVNVVGTSIKFLREESNIKKIEPSKLNNSSIMVAPEKPSTSRLTSYVKRNNSPKKMVRGKSKINRTKPVNIVNDSPPKLFEELSNINRMTPRTSPSDYALMFAPEEPTIKRIRQPRTTSNSQKSALVEPMLSTIESPEKTSKYPDMFAPEEISYNRISARIRPRPIDSFQKFALEEPKLNRIRSSTTVSETPLNSSLEKPDLSIPAKPLSKQPNNFIQEECSINEMKSPEPSDSAEKSALEDRNLNIIRSSNNSTNEPETPQVERKECRSCHRFFVAERLRVHEKICKKAKTKKRRVFDPVKHRVQGTDAEPYLKPPLKQPTPKPVRRLNWRKQHQEFILTIRAAKEAQAYVAKGGKLSDLPPPPPSDTSHYTPCPHCGRKFNESAAARHIPKCAEMKRNKSKMAKLSKTQTKVTPRNRKTTQ